MAPPLPPRNILRKSGSRAGGTELSKTALHFSLASASLEFLRTALVQSKHQGVRTFVTKKLQHEHVSVLASLFMNTTDPSAKDGGGDPMPKGVELGAFASVLTEAIHEMVIGGMIGQDRLQGVLLHELGLNPKCWPLDLSPAVLSLLARVLICRLQYHSTHHQPQSPDDTLTLSIWKG